MKCVCGCEVTLEDGRGTYINKDGVTDAFGDVFLVEKRAREWREEHKACKEKPPRETFIIEDKDFIAWCKTNGLLTTKKGGE